MSKYTVYDDLIKKTSLIHIKRKKLLLIQHIFVEQ